MEQPEADSMGISITGYESSPSGCHAEFDLPDHAAVFRDHFPDQPLMPAIGLLSLCEQLVKRWRGTDVQIVALRKIKFTRMITPGIELQLELTFLDSDRYAMVARSTQGEHASGELATTSTLVRRPEVSA
jgi:3-hydroxymyristoyl/3-hydroxydecanoyl-(acyl carrier protein) dehydratase